MGEVPTEKLLGQAIQKARQKAGLTQQALCHDAQLSYSTLAKIERGAIKTPSVFTVAAVARALGITMDDLLGAVVDGLKPRAVKQTSKNGVTFLFLDINGCLVRFFHSAFTRISHETGTPSDVIESTFWHYNDAVCRGEMSLADFNTEFASKLGVAEISWEEHYLQAIEPITEMRELVSWASEHYRVGLLSNIMPGFINKMLSTGVLPQVKYDAIVDSSVVGLIKPDKAIYAHAEKLASVPPEQILFVDDSRTNLMAAEHRGWKVLWFDDFRPEESAERIRNALNF